MQVEEERRTRLEAVAELSKVKAEVASAQGSIEELERLLKVRFDRPAVQMCIHLCKVDRLGCRLGAVEIRPCARPSVPVVLSLELNPLAKASRAREADLEGKLGDAEADKKNVDEAFTLAVDELAQYQEV